MNQSTKTILKSVFVLVLFALSISAFAAWLAPTATAPGNNTNPPVNVGTTQQIKNGSLGLTGNFVAGASIFSGSMSGTTPVLSVTNTNTAPDVNSYALGVTGAKTATATGNSTSYSIYVTPGATTQAGSTASYGLYVSPGSGNGNNYSAYFGGKVGIGKTAPAYSLDVNGTINATSVLVNGVAVGAGGTQWASGLSGVISYNGGNVGIGTTSPHTALEVNGSIFSTVAYNANPNIITYYDIGGNSIGATKSIYSYGSICVGNNNGDCSNRVVANGIGTIITGAGITFPDGTMQTTAAVATTGGEQSFPLGTSTFTAPAGVTTVWVTMVAGGGGGASAGPDGAYGGGAGGSVVDYPVSVVPGHTYSVTVGSGGAGGSGEEKVSPPTDGFYYSNGQKGFNSIFNNITVYGGLGGGSSHDPDDTPGTYSTGGAGIVYGGLGGAGADGVLTENGVEVENGGGDGANGYGSNGVITGGAGSSTSDYKTIDNAGKGAPGSGAGGGGGGSLYINGGQDFTAANGGPGGSGFVLVRW